MSVRYSLKDKDIKDLRDTLVGNLSKIVNEKKVLLLGQVSTSSTVKTFLSEAGAISVQTISLAATSSDSVSEFFYNQRKQLQYPNQSLLDELRRIDPEGEALIYAGSSIDVKQVDGRRIIGCRLPQWIEAERKKVQINLTKMQKGYNSIYFELSSFNVIPKLTNYLIEYSPCVISGDTKEKIAMGADYVYVIMPGIESSILHRICTNLYGTCKGVRIASLTTGLPITVYGYLADTGKIVIFPPVEAIVGYRKENHKMFAPGILVPPCVHIDINCIENSVQRIIDNLKKHSGYRGAFGLDGVMSKNGFIIHDVNPRICAGFSLMSKLLNDNLPLGLIDMLIRENVVGLDDLFHKLHSIIYTLRYLPDLKLWDNPVLENNLRRCIPKHDSGSIDKWKSRVIDEVLEGCVSLVSLVDKTN